MLINLNYQTMGGDYNDLYVTSREELAATIGLLESSTGVTAYKVYLPGEQVKDLHSTFGLGNTYKFVESFLPIDHTPVG